MNTLVQTLQLVAEALDAQQVRYALVGGIAVSIRTEPRFTRDIDLAIAVTEDSQAEMVIRHLSGAGFQPFATVEQEQTSRLATARMIQPGGEHKMVVDLLFASSGIEPEIVQEATLLEVFEGVQFPVATEAHLLALKILAHTDDRPQDMADIRMLLAVMDESGVQQAREALALITARLQQGQGFDFSVGVAPGNLSRFRVSSSGQYPEVFQPVQSSH